MLVKRCSGFIFLMICLAVFAHLITAESLNPIVESTKRNHPPLDLRGKPSTEKDVTIYHVEERLNDLNISINAYHNGELDPVMKKTIDLQMEKMWSEWRELGIDKNLQYRRLNIIPTYQGLENNADEKRADNDFHKPMSEIVETSANKSLWDLDDVFGFLTIVWLMVNVEQLLN